MKVVDTRYKNQIKEINWKIDFKPSSAQYKIMMAILENPGNRSAEIAQLINKNTNNIRSAITILISRCYVTVSGGGLFVND